MKGCGKPRAECPPYGQRRDGGCHSRFNMVIASTVMASLAVAMTLSAWGAQ